MPKIKQQSFTLNNRSDCEAILSKNSGIVSPDDDTGKQLATLQDQFNTLNEFDAYVQQNPQKLKNTGYTYRTLSTKISSNRGKIQSQVNTLNQLLIKQQNFASRAVLKADDGAYAGNGKCYIQFVNVGMGDCSLIATPSGKTILIDLGSSAQSDVNLGGLIAGSNAEIIRSSITSKFFLNGGNTIDLLLLTHPDDDHYNLLETILKGHVSTINMVYFGGTENFADYYPQSNFVRGLVTGNAIKKVVLAETDKTFLGTPITVHSVGDGNLASTGQANTLGKEYKDDKTGEIVLYYEQKDGEVVFKLSILAANANGVWVGNKYITSDSDIKGPGEMKLNGTPNNIRSLVVLVETFGKKILVTGDATCIPEQYVAKTYPDLLKAADTLRFGHHGSPTSSAKVFIDAFQGLKRAVASSGGKNTVVHNLPKNRIIAEYLPKVPSESGDHVIYAFIEGVPTAQQYGPYKNNLFSTGSNGTVQFVESKTVSSVLVNKQVILTQVNDDNI